MNAAVHTIQVDQVTLHRNHIAAIFAEQDRRDYRKPESLSSNLNDSIERTAWDKADAFIRMACEQAAGAVPPLTPPVVDRTQRTEHAMSRNQAQALEVLERLADGDRFNPLAEEMAGGLKHWVDQGYAGEDEDGYFLTPAGRTFAEGILG